MRPLHAPPRVEFGPLLREERAPPASCAKPGALEGAASAASRWADRLVEAQRCLQGVIGQMEQGRRLGSGELLRIQVQAYRATQELELAGKVVEKAVGGVKHVLQTQV